MSDGVAESVAPVAKDVDKPRETRAGDRVGFWEKTALGAGYLPIFFGNAAVKSFAVPVYQMTLKLDPVLLGAALAIPRFWDAITDPAMGKITDNWHSKFGRRKPFIVLGAILQAIAFGAIWMVPTGWGQWGTVSYLVATLLVFYTCFTIFSVPLMSLTYEMTPDYNERTRVTAFGGFFGKAGEFIYQWVFPLTLLPIFASVMVGVRYVGWGVGILILGAVGVIPGLFVKERYYRKASHQKKVKLWATARASFRNKAFVILIGLTICQVLAGMLASNVDYYLIVYSMCGGSVKMGSIWKGVLSTSYAIVGILSIYPVTWLANRYGKRRALAIIFGMVLVGSLGKWVLFTPGHVWKIVFDPLLCGPVWIALNVLTPSMLADVCDDDELRHGFRREGMYGSIFSWIQKTGYSLAFFGTGVALDASGFDVHLGGAQHPSTILAMRLFLAVSTAVWAIAAIVLLYYYPLTRRRAYEIQDALEARRGVIERT